MEVCARMPRTHFMSVKHAFVAAGFDSCSPPQKARLREGAGLRFVYGASDRNRTRNPLITNQLLYR